MSLSSDLDVRRISESLSDTSLDVVVTGSIGAVESVRFIRALRRLGTKVTPWLSEGGKQFTTPTALAWAAAQPVRDAFSGDASHIAQGDACIVAPASAQAIAKIAHGLTDSPSSALIASYLGQGKPVLVLPNMHESLLHSPLVEDNIDKISKWVTVLRPRREEGKAKFPQPEILADQVSHYFNRNRFGTARVLVTMGPTRGYIDDVRYISNYSSGKLGSLISEELYRLGFKTWVISGPAPVQPRVYHRLSAVQTHLEMADAIAEAAGKGYKAGVFSAAVLDFAPKSVLPGKKSSSDGTWTITLEKTEKLLAKYQNDFTWKAAFKLETGLDSERALEVSSNYVKRYDLNLVIANNLSDVDRERHKAWVFEGRNGQIEPNCLLLSSKEAIAICVASHLDRDVPREPVNL